jgi:hypothetical protein
MSTLKVDTILKRTGTGTITLGQSGDTIALGSGASQTGFGGNNKPLVSVYASADTSMSDNVYVKVPFNTENFDADNTFDSSTNYRFVAPNDGKYLITTQVGVQSNSDNGLYSQQSYIAKNGSEFIGKFQNFGNAAVRHHYDSMTVLASLSQNDYIEVFTRADWYQASSSNIYGGSKNTFINILEVIE